MNIEIVEDEIYNFCVKYFKTEIRLAKDCEDYIISNNLKEPKKNYAILADFLKLLMQRMTYLDKDAISQTLFRLSRNVQTLYKAIVNLEKKKITYKNVFFNEFVAFSDILQNSKRFKNYKRLENIYFDIFKDTFHKEARILKIEMGNGLNTLSFYNDKLIWIEAHKSHFIKKHFEINGIPEDVLDSKHFLINSLKLMRKDTKGYDYYMSCIRIFK
jgi:GMP synthase PP-ATPase subunit